MSSRIRFATHEKGQPFGLALAEIWLPDLGSNQGPAD
jgi:hypothetical protein